MTDKEKQLKLKKLADAMYYAAQQLTTDASRLHKAMDEYHQFIINEYHEEEPVSEDLDIAASEYLKQNYDIDNIYEEDDLSIRNTFKAGANWQKEQFEKNRLKHCNSITNEQAKLEQGFIDQHLDKYNRMPTYLDAVEYGMNLQKEQMMKKAVDGVITFDYYKDDKAYGCVAHDSFCLEERELRDCDKVKIIVVKEG